MKIRTILLTAAVFATSNANAEPFGGTRYIYAAPAGSDQPQQMVTTTVERFNERGQNYVSIAPAGTDKPRIYVKAQSQGFIDRDSSVADSNFPYGIAVLGNS